MAIRSVRVRGWLRPLAALTLLAAIGACAADRLASPKVSEGEKITVRGSAALVLATPAGFDRRELGEWSASGTVVAGMARRQATPGPDVAAHHSGEEAELQEQARRTAESLVRVLSVRDDVRRSEPGRVFVSRAWNDGGAAVRTGVLIGRSGLPETVVLFRNDVAMTLTRYTYVRDRNGWRVSSAVNVAFENETPRVALVATVDGSSSTAATLGEQALRLASGTMESVRESVAFKRMADALVPPLHAYEEDRCWREMADYGAASAAVVAAAAAVAVACVMPTYVCAAAIIAYMKAVEVWTAALDRLYQCHGFRIGDGGGGGTSSTFVIWTVPERGTIEQRIREMEHAGLDMAM